MENIFNLIIVLAVLTVVYFNNPDKFKGIFLFRGEGWISHCVSVFFYLYCLWGVYLIFKIFGV